MFKKIISSIISISFILNSSLCYAESNQDRLKTEIANKINPKINEAKQTIAGTKTELEAGAKDIAAGYLFSTVSLLASTFVGYQVLTSCFNQISAKVYFMTAAVYIAREIANFKEFKASQLGSIKIVDDIKVNEAASFNENINNVKGKVDEQINYFKQYKLTLDNGFKAIKNKADNAKLTAVGFAAASATAVAEQLNMINNAGNCVGGAFSVNQPEKKWDTYYLSQISQAQKMEDRWALFSEWEMMRIENASGPNLNDYKNYKANYPALPLEFFKSTISAVSNLVIPQAFAAKEVIINQDLKDNKAADYIGDLDKLGIVGGAALVFASYKLGFDKPFLEAIGNGTTRAIIFGAQSVLAFMAYDNFNKGATLYIERLKKIDDILNQMGSTFKTGLDQLLISDGMSAQIEALFARVNIPCPKTFNQMTIRETVDFMDSNISNSKFNSADTEKILVFKQKIQDTAGQYDKKIIL